MVTKAKKALVIGTSFLLLLGTFWVEQVATQKVLGFEDSAIQIVEGKETVSFSKKGSTYSLFTQDTDVTTVKLAPNALLRASKQSELTFTQGEIDLLSGRLWINTLFTVEKMTVEAGAVKIVLDPGIFDVSSRDGQLKIVALRRGALVSVFDNPLIVPEQRQMILSEAKLAEASDIIAKLRYAKLSKEFPLSAIKESDAWAKLNQEKDETFNEEYRAYFLENIRSRGPVSTGESTINSIKSVLTINPDKVDENKVENLFNYFDAALYAMLLGKTDEATSLLSTFQTEALVQSQNASFKEHFYRRSAFVEFANPSDSFFPAKKALREAMSEDPMQMLATSFYDVLDAAFYERGQKQHTIVQIFMRRFGAEAEKAVVKMRDPETAHQLLLFLVEMHDFLNRNPYLFKEEFLKTASLLERTHLALITPKEAAEDQRQYFIQEKIRRVQLLKKQMETGEVDFQDGRGAILLLANEVEALRPSFSNTAVLAYFDQQLVVLQPFFAFLKSTRAENVRGSYIEAYKDYQENSEEIKKVNELLGASEGGTQLTAPNREALAAAVAADGKAVGLTKIKITLPSVAADGRVRIVSSEFEGKQFKAIYDTERKVFSEINFDNKAIANPIKKDNLQNFLLIKLGKKTLGAGVSIESLTEQPTPETLLEKVAKSALLKELDTLQIDVEEKNLDFTDFKEKSIIHVKVAFLGEGTDARVFAFDVNAKTNKVSALKVQTVSGDIPVNEEFAIELLPERVEGVFKRALLDKSRE